MNKTTYLTNRKKLYDEAQKLINDGDIKAAEDKMNEIRKLDEDFENAAGAQANLDALNGNVPKFSGFNSAASTDPKKATVTDMYNTDEYRTAFMNFFVKGENIPEKFTNQNQATTSADTVTVPTHLYEKIFFKLQNAGQLYARVFKTNYPAALLIPVATTVPTASWVDEDKGSDRQKHTDDKVQFSAYKLDCRLALSLFTSITTLEMFEGQFVEVVSNAMIIAIEEKIAAGSGVGCPKGILTETTDKVVEIAAADGLTYQTFVDTEALLPAAYDGTDTVYLMTKKTFMKYYGIVDDNGQPIARINAGLDGKPSYNILGREVIPTDGYMSNYADTVSEDTTVAAIFNLKHYILNEILGLSIKRYVDEDTDQTILKAVMLVDGKVVDKNSLVKVVKKA